MEQKILFTKDECVQIINYKNYFDISNPDKKNRVGDSKSIKKYNFYMIERNDETKWVFERLFNWFFERTGISVSIENVIKGYLHNYNVGDAFPKHIDMTEEFKYRLYNVGVQLNSDYEGGDYIIYPQNEIISKETGNSYYYASDVPHEVKKIISGNRWSFLYHINRQDINPKHYKANKLL